MSGLPHGPLLRPRRCIQLLRLPRGLHGSCAAIGECGEHEAAGKPGQGVSGNPEGGIRVGSGAQAFLGVETKTKRVMCACAFPTKKVNCSACAVGSSQPAAGQAACVACGAGQFASTRGRSNCMSCASGKIAAAALSDDDFSGGGGVGASACEPCPRGAYQPASGQASCEGCPSGRASNASGASACEACPGGR